MVSVWTMDYVPASTHIRTAYTVSAAYLHGLGPLVDEIANQDDCVVGAPMRVQQRPELVRTTMDIAHKHDPL